MRRNRIILIAALGAVCAVLAPLLLSLEWSRALSEERLRRELERFAEEAMVRTQRVVDETAAMLQRLNERPKSGCGEEDLKLLREEAVSSRYVKGVGYLERGRLVCSSFGRLPDPVTLGEPDYRGAQGYGVWFVSREEGDAKQLLLQRGDYVALVDAADLVDVIGGVPDRRMALFITPDMRLLVGLNDPVAERSVAFARGQAQEAGRFFALVVSETLPLLVVADQSSADLRASWRAQARVTLPVGLLLGLGMAWGVRRMARKRLSLAGEIEAAIRNREFLCVYQPLIDLETGCCIGAESLVRWKRWDGEMVRPDLFIPTAERHGLIGPITDQCIEALVNDLAPLLARRPELHIAINLVAEDLHEDRIVEVVKRAIQGSGIRPGQVWLEATERGFMEPGKARGVMRRMRERGHAISIDDFGTGYSNLSYLQDFEVDALKIDKAFVDAIGAGAATSHVIDHIIEMAKKLDLTLIAEGIEQEEQAQYLRDAGVDIGQGYLFARPLAPGAFIQFVEERNG